MEYDQESSEYTGFVDLGQNFSMESDDLATEALVFLVVGLTGHWKQVVAYFLINGLCSDILKELVLHAIDCLDEVGVLVRAITLDGLKTNISMLKKLGCSFDPTNIISHFTLPCGRKVHCFIDACHCLKLVRNTLCRIGVIEVPGTGSAKWSHLQKLNELQKKEGLSAANKLSSRHIQYQQQIMKVSYMFLNMDAFKM